jgi:hypothetical protein
MLLLVLAILQFGIWAHAQHVAQAAARDGAEAARAYGGTDRAARNRATTSLDRLGPTILRDPKVDIDRTNDEVTVTVSGNATSILGLFSFPVSERVRGPLERFVPNDRGFTISDGSSGGNRSVGAR